MDNTERYLLPNEKKRLAEAKVPFKKLSKLSSTERKKYDIDYLLKRSKDIKTKKFVVFNKHGQYLGAWKTYDDAVRHIRRLDDTEGWVSEPLVIQFDNTNESINEAITIPKKKEEVLKLIKDAPKIKATSKDTDNLWIKISTSLVGPLEDLMYKTPYDKAYSAGYNGDKEPKNPFKKDTLAYWFFTNLYTQGGNDS